MEGVKKKPESKLRATVLVKIGIDVVVGPWRGDASFDEVAERAKREATEAVERLLHAQHGKMRMYHEPLSARVVLTEEE